MKAKVRRITVENQVFVWSYTDIYERAEDVFVSRLFFSPQNRKQIMIECYFKSIPHFMGCHLNLGFLAIKDGKEYEINCNQPGFISEFLAFILNNKVDFSRQERYRFDNAFEFLNEMGYHSFKSPSEFYPL